MDDSLFVNNKYIEVLQVRWHPASTTDSHLLALLSDNSIRVYNVFELLYVWRVGPIPNFFPPTESNLPFLNSLGDTAVDFDIAPERLITLDPAKEDTKVIWPIIILRGNGTIYILQAGLDTDADRPPLQGPISILPSSFDNYGVESCSILIIPSLPPTVVIAENSGNLFHGLLMDSDSSDNNSFNPIDTNLNIYPSEYTIHILEKVVLELGLRESSKSKEYSCPIFLKRDLINQSRYFAYHNTGLHSIVIDLLAELQQFLEKEPDQISVPLLSAPSLAEYLVCTKGLDSNNINAVLGFTVLQMPPGFLLFLSSGQIVSMDLITDPKQFVSFPIYFAAKSKKGLSAVGSRSANQTSFDTQIRTLLKMGISQPILKFDPTIEPTPKESYELLRHAAQTLKDQYFKKHDDVSKEIIKRVKIIIATKEFHKQQLDQLQREQEIIQNNAEQLAERYEDCCEKQQKLSKNCMDLVRIATSSLPVLSAPEKNYCNEIKRINIVVKEMMKKIEQIKMKTTGQDIQAIEGGKKGGRQFSLPPKQEDTIKDLLKDL